MINDVITQINSATNRVNFERNQQNLGNDRLDKEAFLQLLMAKLQHQDPLKPVEDADFLNQQAALAQVEKLDDLLGILQGNSLLEQGGSLVGKRVDVVDPQTRTTSTGVVDSVSFADGSAALSINGQNYLLNQVTKIYGEAAT